MNPRTRRSVLRGVHLVLGIPILGYIYSPYNQLPNYAFVARYIAMPILILSGFWMWIQASPKKSLLVPIGVFLILLGLVVPLPLAPAAQSMPPGTGRTVAHLAVNLAYLGALVGMVCAIIGALRNRKSGPALPTEAV